MTEYTVHYGDAETTTVAADSVKIEDGGVLAFYEQPGDGTTLKSVAADEVLIRAFAEWDKFETIN